MPSTVSVHFTPFIRKQYFLYRVPAASYRSFQSRLPEVSDCSCVSENGNGPGLVVVVTTVLWAACNEKEFGCFVE